MAVRVLSIDIMSYLKGDGFKQVEKQVGKVKSSLNGLKTITSSPLFKMAAGYFGINTAIGQYNKAIEASNYQLAQETKLYSTMRAQGFRDEQITNIKKFAEEQQKLGVVGDEVTLAGAQQLATYNLTEESLKRLIPAMQDVLVQQKGLNGTGQDAVGIANMFGKGILGQTGRLLQAGISLNAYQEQLIKTGTQEQKVAALIEAVTMNVGKQNAEFLKTPEGKIASSQNRIGDVYEYLGGLVRDTRANFWTMLADNEEVIKSFLGGVFATGAGLMDTLLSTTNFLFNTFKNMPPEVKVGIKLLTGFFFMKKFPIATAVLVVEDIFAAFQGKESVTEEAMNALFEFTGADYKFEDLRKDINDFWHDLTNPADKATEKISGVTTSLELLLETLRGGLGLLEIVFGGLKAGTWDLGKLIGSTIFDPQNFDKHIEEFNNGGVKVAGKGLDLLLDSGDKFNKALDRYSPSDINAVTPTPQLAVAGMPNINLESFAREMINRNSDTDRITQQVTPVTVVPNINFNESMNTGFKDVERLTRYLNSRKENSVNKNLGTTKEKIIKLKPQKPSVLYTDRSTYEINVKGDDKKDIAYQIEKMLRQKEEEKMERLKTMYGGDYRLGDME